MRILILGNQADSPTTDEDAYYRRFETYFAESSQATKLNVRYTLFRDLFFDISSEKMSVYDTRHDNDIADYDLVVIRGQMRRRMDFVYVISRYLQSKGKTVINVYSHQRSSSKLSQAYTFYELGIPSPRTLAGSAEVLLKQYQRLEMPFICKEVYGAHGRNNYLIKNEDQLRDALNKDQQQLYVLQPFIPNDGDFRLLIIGPRWLVIKRTASPDTHLNNTSQGGSAELLDPTTALPSYVVDQAIRCRDFLSMAISGADIIHDQANDQYIFLEINSQPQLLTGAFVAEKQQLLGQYLSEIAA